MFQLNKWMRKSLFGGHVTFHIGLGPSKRAG